MYNAALGLIYDFDPVKIVCFLLLNFIACGLIAKSIVTLNAGKTICDGVLNSYENMWCKYEKII